MNNIRARFRPPLWSTALLLALCTLFVSAGLWQLDRANQKRALFRAFDQADQGPPLDRLVDDTLALPFRYRRFSISGYYDNEHQILLDSMIYEGRAGFQVLTPLIGGEKAILVNRGWFPQSADRSRLPDLSVDSQNRQVTGRLDLLPRSGFALAPAEQGTDQDLAPWPRRLLFPSAQEIEQHLGYSVYHYQLLLSENDQPGFIRDWRPGLSGSEKNIGYAIQWFSFTLAIIVIYVVMNFRRTGKGAS